LSESVRLQDFEIRNNATQQCQHGITDTVS